jgi:hypothetical protein
MNLLGAVCRAAGHKKAIHLRNLRKMYLSETNVQGGTYSMYTVQYFVVTEYSLMQSV